MPITGLAFLALFALGSLLSLLRHPIFGLYLYVAMFYLHPPSRWWGQAVPDFRWALLAAVIALISVIRLPRDDSRAGWLNTVPAKALILYTCLLWVQNLWAMDAELHLEASILFSKYVLLYFLVYRLVDTDDKVTTFLLVHVAGCFYLGVLAFYSDVSGRLTGVGGPGIDEANALAMHVGTGAIAGAALILAQRGWIRAFAIGAMPFILNTMILAESRSAFLAIIAGGVVLWRLCPAPFMRQFRIYAILGAILLGLLAHQMFWDRMKTIVTLDEDQAVQSQRYDATSAEKRLNLIKGQVRMFMDYPFGTGHRGTQVLSPGYFPPEQLTEAGQRSSHNTFMTTLVEQGVPGGLIFVWLMLWVVTQGRRLASSPAVRLAPQPTGNLAAIMSMLTVVFIAGIFVDYLKAEVTIWLLAMLASFVAYFSVKSPAKPDRDSA